MGTKTQIPKLKPKITQNRRPQTPNSPKTQITKTQIPRPKTIPNTRNPKLKSFRIVTSLFRRKTINKSYNIHVFENFLNKLYYILFNGENQISIGILVRKVRTNTCMLIIG